LKRLLKNSNAVLQTIENKRLGQKQNTWTYFFSRSQLITISARINQKDTRGLNLYLGLDATSLRIPSTWHLTQISLWPTVRTLFVNSSQKILKTVDLDSGKLYLFISRSVPAPW
jgi:hypothetical protein